MLSINEKISLRQLQALIIISSMGTGVIILPRRVAEYANQDGWIIVLGLVILAMVIGALVTTAARLRPEDTFIESTGHFLTRPVAFFLGAVLWAKLVFVAGLELRAFLLIVREVLLGHTPILVTGGVMLAVATYAAIKGIETRARVAEILLVLMALPFIFLIIVAVLDIDWSNLQPVFTTPPENLLKGTLRLGFMFTGLECLLLVSPYIYPDKKMRKSVVAALGFSGVIIVIITLLTLTKFGRGVVDHPWPVLAMMDMLNLPGAFIERQEALMFSFWIITTFAFLNALLFFGGVLIKNMLKSNPHSPSRANRKWQIGILITAAMVFAVSAIPWDETAIYLKLDFTALTSGAFFLVVLPILLIVISKFRGRRALSLILLMAIILPSITACWDKVEIENRAFVVAIGVDRAENGGYTLSLSLPTPSSSNDGENDDEDPAHVKIISAQTISEAIHKLDAETDTILYFGQTKMLVLGESLLKDSDLVKGVIDAFNRHPELDQALHVLAAQGKAVDILKAYPPGNALPGQYVAGIYRDKRKTGGISFNMDLERLTTQTKHSHGVLIPSLYASEKTLVLSGAALMIDSRKVGQLTSDELQGYLWCVEDGGLGAIVTAQVGGHPLPFKVESHSAKVRFHNQDGRLSALVNVELYGLTEEYAKGSESLNCAAFRKEAERQLESAVRGEILATVAKMQNEFAIDGYNWLEVMRKKQYSLYQRHSHYWRDVFPEINIVPHVTVNLRS